MSAELDPKRLQVLHEIVPGLSRVAFLVSPNLTPGLEERFAGAEAAARSHGIALQRVDAATPAELAVGFAAITALSSEALLIQNDPMLSGTVQSRILDFAAAHGLPTVWENKGGVKSGGLLRCGYDPIENARLAAGYAAKILQGAKTADLPVQQPTRFALVINLKTAKVLGLTIPHTILALADEVIE